MITAALTWCASPLLGEDGRPSWSKLVLAAVVLLYALERPLPPTVAIVAILASYGAKVLLKGLALIQVKLGVSDGLQQLRSRVETIAEVREPSPLDKHWDDET